MTEHYTFPCRWQVLMKKDKWLKCGQTEMFVWFVFSSLFFLTVQQAALAPGVLSAECWGNVAGSSTTSCDWGCDFPLCPYSNKAVLGFGDVVSARHSAAAQPPRFGGPKLTSEVEILKWVVKPNTSILPPSQNVLKYILKKKKNNPKHS